MDSTAKGVRHLEIAARNVDKALINDGSAYSLLDVMNVSAQTGPTSSGTTDNDYPNLARLPLALNNIVQLKMSRKVPLPTEILERINHIQSHSMMGLFPDINRAWLTVDSDIYMWTYEEGSDVAYYDGINETILCVGLITPRPGVFRPFIKYLLILTTATDIYVLGVTFTASSADSIEEIQLVPDPVFTLPTDGSIITAIAGTSSGRIFLGSKEGDLYEISYQAESSWFGKRCKKLNHSTSTLSYLMPSFVNAALSDEDPITQISIDNSRHILYMLTDKGSIWVYDLGETGNSLSKITKLTQASLVQQAMNTVKTLDSQNFRPVVGISAIEGFESPHVNLVAVSQTGVRFYLTVVGLSNLQPNQRPYTLTLVHVRLPPGYSAVLTTRPRMVHMANYKESNLMLLSTINERDTLWCITSDMFPFSSMFMESYTTVALDGLALAMGEVNQHGSILRSKPFQQLPPLAVRQHFEPPRKFVVLTAQGAYIFIKLRPVDILRQLLVDSRGPENNTIKAFFAIQKEEQACATSLILACSESVQNVDVADWAARAFFVYGGEPKISSQTNAGLNQSNLYPGSPSFMPNYMSTPMRSHASQHQLLQSPTSQLIEQQHNPLYGNAPYSPYVYSAKHNGLYLYLGRIVRPIWNLCCTEKLDNCPDGKIYLSSSITADECTWILSYLNSLWTFLQKNTLLSIHNSANEAVSIQSTLPINTPRLNQTVQDAQLEERLSLESFRTLVNSCCQVVGLWKILCEHQFHILVETLPSDYQQVLLNISFKELVLRGQDICTAFVNSLIASYLTNNALIDTISTKLRGVCPELYKNEDAACSKAYEMLKLAKSIQNINEKEDLISSALQLCQSVAPNVNLREVCQQFISLSAYHALVDLCVTCAKRSDPDNLAEYYYKNSDANQDAYNNYTKRMYIYKEILSALDYLKIQSPMPEGQSEGKPGICTPLLKDKDDLLLNVILDILQYPDVLLHVAVYEWMMTKGMEGDLIKYAQPSLEKYLIKASHQPQENIPALDLLWKYYENTNNHLYAAKILHNLSSLNGNMLTLKQRIAYLSRAIMCMRSDKVGYSANHGIVLRDMEDKMDIAKIQELILDSINADYATHQNVEEAISALNSGLYDLTQLYEEFADTFNLWECKLAIIECAGHTDNDLVQNIWHNIIKQDILKYSGSASDDRLTQLLMKITSLIREYRKSSLVPVSYLVEQLEILSINLKTSVQIVPNNLFSEIPIEELFHAYNILICTPDKNNYFWTIAENEFHLAESFVELVNKFLSRQSLYDHQLKMKIKSYSEDAIAKLLSRVYGKPNTEQLIGVLRGIQNCLTKI